MDRIDITKIDGLIYKPLKIIGQPNGSVLHGIKTGDSEFAGFGEAYFSTIISGAVKGWKRHNRMTMNLIVVSGAIRFGFYDTRESSSSYRKYALFDLSRENYGRITVVPGLWMAFSGLSQGENILLNFANIPHDPSESDSLALGDPSLPKINWEIK